MPIYIFTSGVSLELSVHLSVSHWWTACINSVSFVIFMCKLMKPAVIKIDMKLWKAAGQVWFELNESYSKTFFLKTIIPLCLEATCLLSDIA